MSKQMLKAAGTVCLFLALLLGSTPAFAQNVTVKGNVKDAAGVPVIGASVIQQGTTNGVITDFDGNYQITVPASSSLQFSSVGYIEQVISVEGKTVIDVVLAEDTELLEEVVVVGYGVQKKSDLTGSVASVRKDDLKNRSTTDAAAALQGKAAGVQVITNNGAPGTASEIRVRGISSNSGNIGPLLIVDGLKVDNIQYLDPSMIESMEILKDAASAAIYGAEAGNGVVLITTKSGAASKGSGKVFYNGQWTLNSLSRNLDIMNAQQYIDYGKDRGWLTQATLDSAYDGKTDVDWSRELFVPTWSNRQTVGVQGGNDRGSYFATINNVNDDGIFRGDKDTYKRLTFQLNADYKIKDWLIVGTNNSLEKWSTKGISQQNDNGSVLLSAITSTPLFSPRASRDQLTPVMLQQEASGHVLLTDPENPGMYWIAPGIGETQSGHPYVRRDATESSNGGFNLRGVLYANLMPVKGLTITSRLGYRINQSSSHNYTVPYYSTATLHSDTYTLDAAANTGYYYQWENFANFNRTFGKHDVTAMAGMSYIENNWDNVSVSASGTDILKGYEPNFRYIDYLLPGDGVTKNMNNNPGRSASLSYFARLGYAYDNRYAVQANFRADAFDTSKLPADKRWGFFPSVSAGWTISNESFIKDNISRDVLSFLKIRASWGINGNINVLNNYPYSSSIITNCTFYQYDPASTTASLGSYPAGLANPGLTWETSEQIDLGIDARMFRDRLTVGIDLYTKDTRDLLVGTNPVKEIGLTPAYDLGMTANVVANAGNVNNKGLEVELGWKDNVGDFHYGISANASWLSNKVTYLDPSVGRLSGRVPQGTQAGTFFETGYPVWYLLGYKGVGIDKEGHAIYEAADGTQTINPSQNDRQFLGSTVPNFMYGLTLNFAYRGFDLVVFGNGVSGNTIFPTSWRSDRPECNTYAYYWNNSWKKAGDEATAKFPSAKYWDEVAFSSSFTMFNGAYFKIKQIQLGYTLPSNFTKKFFVSNLRVFASLDNFFTFTNYIGLDPETATTGGNAVGIDMGTYPTSKSVVLGVNVEF